MATAAEPVVTANVFRAASGSDAGAVPQRGAVIGGDGPRKKKGYITWSTSRLVNTLRIGNCCNGLILALLSIFVFVLPTDAMCVV